MEAHPANLCLLNHSDTMARLGHRLILESSAPVNHQQDQAQMNEDSEQMRKMYLSILEEQFRHPEVPDYWKKQFILTAEGILQKLSSYDSEISHEVKIGYINTSQLTTHMYSFKDRKVILVGRYQSQDQCCDIVLRSSNDTNVSRIHIIIIPIPNEKKYALIDVGSFYGIKIVKKGDTVVDESSLPNSRRVLFVSFDEFAVVQTGSDFIVINPKECVICMEKPRGVMLHCGHNVVCPECSRQIAQCPVCRAQIQERIFPWSCQSSF